LDFLPCPGRFERRQAELENRLTRETIQLGLVASLYLLNAILGSGYKTVMPFHPIDWNGRGLTIFEEHQFRQIHRLGGISVDK
jgi:hypothetical protein